MKVQDMLSTGVGVPRVSKVEVLVGNIELNCWTKREERERTTPIVAYNYGFLTQENADPFQILIRQRQQVWSNGSYML